MEQRMEIFGHFTEIMPEKTEYLIISFSPTSFPLKQRWRANGLSADFIADYLRIFFVGYEDKESKKKKKNTAPIPVRSKNAVKYIANELLENTMKFHEPLLGYPHQAQIMFNLQIDKLIFQVSNTVSAKGRGKLDQVIQTLLTGDPQALYLEQMEANAMDNSEHYSGLGFLSMMCDYSAKIGWKITTICEDPLCYNVTTMVTLDL